MDKLSEIIKLPIRRSGQSVDDYLDLLVCTLRNMIELISKNTNTLHQLFIIGGGAGVVDHGGLTGLTDADHPATAIVNTPAGNIAATTVQAAINELDTEKSGTGHVHAASAITNTPAGNIAATNVQTALNELDTEKIAAPASPEQGDILYYSGSAWLSLPHGTDGQVLKTGDHGANPSWIDIPAQSFRLPERAHTADAVLTTADMGKNHTDNGAGETDIIFTLPGSPTNGDIVMFTHRTVSSGTPDKFLYVKTASDVEKIVVDNSGSMCNRFYLNRESVVGISFTLVAGADNYWYLLSEQGNPGEWSHD